MAWPGRGLSLMERGKRTLLLAAALLVVSTWYLGTGGGPLERPPAASEFDIVQTYLINSRSQTYAIDGVLAQVMEAARVEHLQDTDVSELQLPRFYSHDGNNQTWSASAEYGELTHRTGVLILRQDVVLTNDKAGGVLESSVMTVDLKARIAKSAVPVKITLDDNVLTADGMYADLKGQTIRLAPNVEGTYVPEGS
ncbi:MAG: LPS export ABC transporter periplasmic protein LptC [Haliea sp.]|nr:LPS export ABC transporter periplasmic protein LptC [Haliea sp.]